MRIAAIAVVAVLIALPVHAQDAGTPPATPSSSPAEQQF
jgi:hypothetical protein